MKDGRTHLAYKAEHAVDLASEAIVATTVTFADKSDPQSGPVTLSLAEANLVLAGSDTELAEAVMDKGYHDNRLVAGLTRRGVRTYIPERRQKSRCWTDKPHEEEQAFRANRRRVRGKKGRRLNRWRSERCERTFAHVCETGGGRRAWVRGQTNVSKVHTLKCAAYNLGLLLRKVWGYRKPRNADAGAWGPFFWLFGSAGSGNSYNLWDHQNRADPGLGLVVADTANIPSRPQNMVAAAFLEKDLFFNGLLARLSGRCIHAYDCAHRAATRGWASTWLSSESDCRKCPLGQRGRASGYGFRRHRSRLGWDRHRP
jgi:hypothetical protein